MLRLRQFNTSRCLQVRITCVHYYCHLNNVCKFCFTSAGCSCCERSSALLLALFPFAPTRSLQRPLPGPHSLRAIRVSAKDNLMYIEQASDTAARLASATTPEIMASTPPMAAPGSIEAPGGAAQDGGRCVPVPFGTKPAQTDVTPAQVPADKVITFKAKYPYAAIGRLDINGGTCSGSQIGDYTVLTAAHCVYDRKTKKWGKATGAMSLPLTATVLAPGGTLMPRIMSLTSRTSTLG